MAKGSVAKKKRAVIIAELRVPPRTAVVLTAQGPSVIVQHQLVRESTGKAGYSAHTLKNNGTMKPRVVDRWRAVV
jgi:hypothetical protein